MKSNIDLTTGMSTLAEVNAGLLAIAVTLVALIPTLIEIVRIKEPNFLIEDAARRRLKNGLSSLTHTIWLFGIATILSLVGIIYQPLFLLIIIVLISISSLLLLLRAGIQIASLARTLI